MASEAQMLEHFLRRDRSWDGRFLAGVVTTGIYCLPSCPARRPKPENVRFFTEEDGARAAGLRPCRRCRPDRFLRSGDPDMALFETLLQRIRAEPGAFEGVPAIAAAAATGSTRLNELFRRHGHTTPAAALQRARVAHAAHQLLHTDRRLVDIALDAGFESSSVFHDNFRSLLGTTPRGYRTLRERTQWAIELPAEFRHADTLSQLGRDPSAPDQQVNGRHVAKALWLDERPAVLQFELRRQVARCALVAAHEPSLAARAQAHAIARRMLGLDDDPVTFERRARRDRAQRELVRRRPGLRVLCNAVPFEALVWSVIGQQINLPLAFRCRTALLQLAQTPCIEGLRPHPEPAALAALDPADLRRHQFSGRKIEYLQDCARAIAAGELPLAALGQGSAVQAQRTLLATRGIGPWSCHYVMMRGFGLPDCVPLGDTGITRALQLWRDLAVRPDADVTATMLEPFAPFRSLACWHLWR